MYGSTTTLPPVPPLKSPNAVRATYIQWRNMGIFYLPRLGGPPLSIEDWRDREIARWEKEN